MKSSYTNDGYEMPQTLDETMSRISRAAPNLKTSQLIAICEELEPMFDDGEELCDDDTEGCTP